MYKKQKAEFLPKYNIILSHSQCSPSDLTYALKMIFNIDFQDGLEILKEVKLKDSVVLETVHKEKLELRENQIKAWNEKGVSILPIHFIKILGE